MFTIRTKMASPIPNESEKVMLHILLHWHDFPDFVGVAWVPSWYCVDPQKLESKLRNQWEDASVDLWEGAGEEAGWNPLLPPSPCLQCVMGGVCTALSWKQLSVVQGSFAIAGPWLVMHGLGWVFCLLFFSSRPIHLWASWNREHNLCKKVSCGEKSVFKEFSACTQPCVWNCFTSVTSNT